MVSSYFYELPQDHPSVPSSTFAISFRQGYGRQEATADRLVKEGMRFEGSMVPPPLREERGLGGGSENGINLN